MNTKLLKVHPDPSQVKNHPGLVEGGRILREGGLVAFPTETVYGLGANGLNPDAVKKIYQAKGRPADNPLILHIADFNKVEQLVAKIPDQAEFLIQQFWPGPLTLVLKKRDCIPSIVTGGLDTVAIRMPSHPIAQELILQAGVPIAAPSANRSGKPSPTLAKHVIADLSGKVEMIIDGGSSEKGIESTVLDMSQADPVLLRPGSISYEELKVYLHNLTFDLGIEDRTDQTKDLIPRSPGMKYRHYSPEAELLIITGSRDRVEQKLRELVLSSQKKLGLLISSETAQNLKNESISTVVKILGNRGDFEEMAMRLFQLLREFDEDGVELILVEGQPSSGLGLALMNRLNKAAGHQILQV